MEGCLMKQQARQAALQELVSMILPSLMEEMGEGESTAMPTEIIEEMAPSPPMEEMADDDYSEKEEKPKVIGMSLTRLMADKSMIDKAKKAKKKPKGKRK